ncbi:pyridoxal phosphate-dependent aminotransferase [Cryomorphaceae bacterium]|nr:pyridoxal phosphate-dependent aminotransferase [Cryomorphaceae bacterium]
MPSLSQKGQRMPSSPIRKLVPFADAAKAGGTTVYHLNIGQPDIKTPEVVQDAIHVAPVEIIAYSHSEGILTYREGLAKYYRNVGLEVNAHDIMVTTGGSEALSFIIGATMDPDDELIVPEPFYANYNGFSIANGVNVRAVTASIEDGFALPTIEEFEKLIGPKTKAILICNPGNPTGYLYSEAELEQLRALVIKHDLYLIADEVYREFCYDGRTHHSVMAMEGLDNHAIMVDSVSKRYSMCGARIGCIVSRNSHLMATIMKFAQARLSPPSLGQIAAEAALKTPQSYFDEVIEEYVERRDVLVDGLNKIPGVRCPKPSGAFYCIAELPVDDADKFAEWLLSDFSYEGGTVMMAPASGFYSTPGKGKQEVRIAYVLNIESLKKSLTILEKALEAYPGRIG